MLDPHPRIGVAAQTTQSIETVRHLVAVIRQRFPRSDVRFVDTVCRPTKDRQNAARDLARQSDVVIVVGGAHSNNIRELARSCRLFCSRVHQVEAASDLCPEWLRGADTVGITAGTSTPDELVDAVEALEGTEELVGVLHVETGAVVPDETDPAVVIQPAIELDDGLRGAGGVLPGVIQQVVERLPHQHRVCLHPDAGGKLPRRIGELPPLVDLSEHKKIIVTVDERNLECLFGDESGGLLLKVIQSLKRSPKQAKEATEHKVAERVASCTRGSVKR